MSVRPGTRAPAQLQHRSRSCHLSDGSYNTEILRRPGHWAHWHCTVTHCNISQPGAVLCPAASCRSCYDDSCQLLRTLACDLSRPPPPRCGAGRRWRHRGGRGRHLHLHQHLPRGVEDAPSVPPPIPLSPPPLCPLTAGRPRHNATAPAPAARRGGPARPSLAQFHKGFPAWQS